MTYTEPTRTAARRTRVTVYSARRRGVLFGAVAVVLLIYTAFAGTGHPRNDTGSVPNARGGIVNGKHRVFNGDRMNLSPVSWPQRGQAALILGDGLPSANPNEQPAPIASLAKVMTAYLTLERWPLSDAQDGSRSPSPRSRHRPRARASRSWRYGPASG